MRIQVPTLLMWLSGCGATHEARERLSQGDWGGARNILDAAHAGKNGSVEDRALTLFTYTTPDVLAAGTLLQRTCALDPVAVQTILQPDADESNRLERQRSDLRRSLQDKGIYTSSTEDYSSVLRETVRYALHDQPWRSEHALAQGAYGLCALWMGMDGGDAVLMEALRSKSALEHGATSFIGLAGPRIVEPLRLIALNHDDVASGPASDALRELLEPDAILSILQGVHGARAPASRLNEIASQEAVALPSVRASRPTRSNATAKSTIRSWFGLSKGPGVDVDLDAWASSSFAVGQRPVRIFWTWDSDAELFRLYGLVWIGTSWERIQFDGQDPWTDPVRAVLAVRPIEGGFAMSLFEGIGEEAMERTSWAGTQTIKHRTARTTVLTFNLESTAAVPVDRSASP